MITPCLLLSRDIHSCPGPNGEVCTCFNKGQVMDSELYLAERNLAAVHVRASCSDMDPNMNSMANNICMPILSGERYRPPSQNNF